MRASHVPERLPRLGGVSIRRTIVGFSAHRTPLGGLSGSILLLDCIDARDALHGALPVRLCRRPKSILRRGRCNRTSRICRAKLAADRVTALSVATPRHQPMFGTALHEAIIRRQPITAEDSDCGMGAAMGERQRHLPGRSPVHAPGELRRDHAARLHICAPRSTPAQSPQKR